MTNGSRTRSFIDHTPTRRTNLSKQNLFVCLLIEHSQHRNCFLPVPDPPYLPTPRAPTPAHHTTRPNAQGRNQLTSAVDMRGKVSRDTKTRRTWTHSHEGLHETTESVIRGEVQYIPICARPQSHRSPAHLALVCNGAKRGACLMAGSREVPAPRASMASTSEAGAVNRAGAAGLSQRMNGRDATIGLSRAVSQ